jgi:hypothetical protein
MPRSHDWINVFTSDIGNRVTCGEETSQSNLRASFSESPRKYQEENVNKQDACSTQLFRPASMNFRLI